MTENLPGKGHEFVKQRVGQVVEEATRSYYASDPASLERMNRIIAVEEAQTLASLMGLGTTEIIRAYLRGTPEVYRQDYLDTIYDSGVIFGKDASEIAREFELTFPTLGI